MLRAVVLWLHLSRYIAQLVRRDHLHTAVRDHLHTAVALHRAVQEKHWAVVDSLVEQGTHIDARDVEGLTPMHHAAGDGVLETIEELVKRGHPIDATSTVTNYGGMRPLTLAAEQGQHAAARRLLELGADVDGRSNGGGTPLMAAAELGDTLMIHLLTAAGASVDAKSLGGRTPQQWAEAKGQSEAVELLKRLSSASGVERLSIDADGETDASLTERQGLSSECRSGSSDEVDEQSTEALCESR